MIFFSLVSKNLFSRFPPPKCHRAALIRLSVFDYRMQNEEIFKAEPKGMQINYIYIFFYIFFHRHYKHVLEGKVGRMLIHLF